MNFQPPNLSTDGTPVPRSGGFSERTERHLRMLAELAEIGMELARQVGRQALDGGAEVDGDPGLKFARIARAVRQTVALEARLDADARALEQQGAAARASREAAQRARVQQQKMRVKRLVEEAISGATGREADPDDAESLRLDLDERLEDPDIEAELGWRPIGVIFAGICEDLGIKADLSHFTDAELGFDIRPGRMGGVAAGGDALAGGVAGRAGPGHDGADEPDDPEDSEEADAALALPMRPPD